MTSIIEASALQEFGQCYCSYEAEQGPCEGPVQVEILTGRQAQYRTETDDHDSEYVYSDGTVWRGGASADAVEAFASCAPVSCAKTCGAITNPAVASATATMRPVMYNPCWYDPPANLPIGGYRAMYKSDI